MEGRSGEYSALQADITVDNIWKGENESDEEFVADMDTFPLE